MTEPEVENASKTIPETSGSFWIIDKFVAGFTKSTFIAKAPGKKPPVARLTLEDIQNSGASTSNAAAISSDDAQSNYEDELAWCVYNLKTSLTTDKLEPKQGT